MKKAINIGLAALMVLAVSAQAQKSVKIGNQFWMVENLNDASKGGKCYEDKPENCKKYGLLYTWKEATKACPKGWHLPSNEEWQTLVYFAGGDKRAGTKLKAKKGWNDDDDGESGNGTDDFGFSALPGGSAPKDLFKVFEGVGYNGVLWSATELSIDYAYEWFLNYGDSEVSKFRGGKLDFLSVRCVKD